MNKVISARLQQRIAAWSAGLRARGLDSVIGALLDAAEPLAPLGAGALWVANPALSILLPGDELDGLARLLDDPMGIIWLRGALTAEPTPRIDVEEPVDQS